MKDETLFPEKMTADYAWGNLGVPAEDCSAWANGWNARAALQSGNSAQPVTVPAGYVLAPEKPTQEMVWAAKNDLKYTVGWDSFVELYKAMLAAAPKAPDGWIPVSERLPEDDEFVQVWPLPDFGVELHVGQYCECNPKGDGWYAQVYEQNHGIEWYPITVTHWQPLPAAPKGV
ncbi:uncharacterized protein DUF551 [Grimontella sp. AG753]|nr:uncharacterized protein DUF551 [Grimontella sp. AG753]